MTTYTTINIGPITATLGMARKPRELWSASYLFSFLMKQIIAKLPQDKIISPAIIGKDEKNGLGLYPDRVFIRDYSVSFDKEIKPIIDAFAKEVNIDAKYLNVMTISIEEESDSKAVIELNDRLNQMEMFNIVPDASKEEMENKILTLIKKEYGVLFKDAFDNGKLIVETLAEISAAELNGCEEWNAFKEAAKSDNKEECNNAFKNLPKNKLKSYHKYFCVVHADGDNVGTTVSHPELPAGKVEEISKALLQFGKNAKQTIEAYGGLPIYAGGDDLMFIAPVVGKDHTNIVQLLNKLNTDAFAEVKRIVDTAKNGQPLIHPTKGTELLASLSFGVAIAYYKYPLYETLNQSRYQLEGVAKEVTGKNAISIEMRKHSGGSFHMEMSNNNETLKNAFAKLIEVSSVDESLISAVAFKIRENEGLLQLWMGQDDAPLRNNNFFKKYMDYNPDEDSSRKSKSDQYKDAVLNLLNCLFIIYENAITKATSTLYGMLRIAKFINGEEVRDE